MTTFTQQILERAEKATPGPWHICHLDEDVTFLDIDAPLNSSIAESVHAPDAIFIAHSRVDLVEACKRLERAIGTIKALVDNGDCYGGDDCDHCEAILTLEELERPLE